MFLRMYSFARCVSISPLVLKPWAFLKRLSFKISSSESITLILTFEDGINRGGRVGGGVLPIKQVLPAHIALVKLNARARSKNLKVNNPILHQLYGVALVVFQVLTARTF
jgi:hypothetical protein